MLVGSDTYCVFYEAAVPMGAYLILQVRLNSTFNFDYRVDGSYVESEHSIADPAPDLLFFRLCRLGPDTIL